MSKSVIFTIVIVYCYNIYNNNKHYYNITVQKTKQTPPNLTNQPTKCKILYLISLTVLILMYRRFSRHVQESSKFYIHYSKQFAQRTFISYHVYTMVCGWQNALEHWLPVSVECVCSRLTAWANVQVISECLTLRHTCLPSLIERSDINNKWLAAMVPFSTLVTVPRGWDQFYSDGRSVVVAFTVI